MKVPAMLLVIVVLCFAACEYKDPLTEEHTIPVDSSVLGIWEPLLDEGEVRDADERMVILKFSDTEYLIHHPIGEDGLYYRGYPIKIGQVSCVQLQIIGTADGPPKKDNKQRYHVVSYSLANEILEVKILNTELVGDDLKDSKVLREAFLKEQGNRDLFTDPGKFKRITDQS